LAAEDCSEAVAVVWASVGSVDVEVVFVVLVAVVVDAGDDVGPRKGRLNRLVKLFVKEVAGALCEAGSAIVGI